MKLPANKEFIRGILFPAVILIAADFIKRSASSSATCPIPRKSGHESACNGLLRTTEKALDDRPQYYNMSARMALDLIGKVAEGKEECRKGQGLPTLSIRYESDVAFRKQAESAVRVANQMSYLLTRGACGAGENRTSFDLNYNANDNYLYSLARDTFEIDEKIMGAGIIFRKNALENKEYFAPYSLTKNLSFVVRDRSTNMVIEEKKLLEYLQDRANMRNFSCLTSLFTPERMQRAMAVISL